MKNMTKRKGRSGFSLVISAGIFVIALSIAGLFLMEITEKMNRGANQSLLASSDIICEGLDNKIQLDKELLYCLADFIPLHSDEAIEITLKEYAASTDFFKLYYEGIDGSGIDSDGNSVSVTELPFEEIAISKGIAGMSAPYSGTSGRLQIAYQAPILKDGKQTGALYAVRLISDYNIPALFTFQEGEGRAYVVNDSGRFIIQSRGTAVDRDIYDYLESQGNDFGVQEALRRVMQEGRRGTLSIRCNNQNCLLSFLPQKALEGCYLISIVPRAVLQQESASVITMLRGMFGFLLIAGAAVAALFAGRQTMKNNVRQTEERELLFQNLSANIDFTFLLYTPSKRKMELVSENIENLLSISMEQATDNPSLIFDCCGIKEGDADRTAFLNGSLTAQITKECMIGAGTNEVKQWIAVHLIPADHGQYLMVLHDTTKEHHMHDEMADALLQSQNSNRARTAFFSTMSHDIRTPMNGIMGMTTIALNNLDNTEKVKSCLDKITAASGHLLDLINEVLDMSRIESGKMSLKEEEVHLPSLISNIIAFIKPDLDRKSHQFHMKSQVLEHDRVIGDALHLQKILLNLLSNAVKYTPEGGTITLNIQEEPVDADTIQLYFTVTDNGIGMSGEFLERIFNPFERAEDSRMSQVTGTGLGLAITKNIVDIMGGEIYVESQKGAGSKFTVSIPFKLPGQQNQKLPELTGYSVLIIDDEQDDCESIGIMLEENGIQADWALSGREGTEKISKAREDGKPYSVILLDWKMPEMDGLETTRYIRTTLGETVPILLLSAYDWEMVEDEAVSAGITGFLSKPIFKAELLEQLKNCIFRESFDEKEDAQKPIDNLEGMRVLVVEDNALNQEIIIEILESSKASVHSASNGEEALKRFAESSVGYYQLILMDVHMPKMNGLEATRKIRHLDRADAASVPIIAMTADVFKEDIQRCKEAGMDAHIGKPIELDKLYQIINQFKKKPEAFSR